MAHSGNAWRWDSDGEEFWSGLQPTGDGKSVNGMYTNWNGVGEPNG